MKITPIEKAVLGFILVLILGIVGLNYFIFKRISDEGGVRASIVKAGKEIKEIGKEINKE